PKAGGQSSRTLAVPVSHALRANSLRARRAQRFFQFFLDDDLDGVPNPLAQLLLERAFSLPSAPAIPLHSVILRHPPPSGRELWLNSPDLDAFSLFHQLPDTTSGSTNSTVRSAGPKPAAHKYAKPSAQRDPEPPIATI